MEYRILVSNKLGIANLTAGPGGASGAAVALLIFLCALFSSWATYRQFGLGLTYVTLPILLCIFFIVVSFVSGKKFSKLSPVDYLVVVIYFICLSSFTWSLSGRYWAVNIYWYSICFIAYFSVRFFVTTPSRMRLVGYGVIAGVLIGGALVSEQTNEWGLAFDRRMIEGHNSNFTAYVFVGSFYLYIIIHRLGMFTKIEKFMTIPFALLVFIKVMLLGTRGALISFVAILFWMVVHKKIKRIQITIAIGVMLIISLLVSFGLFEAGVSQIGEMSDRGTGDLGGRFPAWKTAREYILGDFFLGIGIGSFPSVNPLGIGAHNVFLTMLLETGFIGFLAFLLLLFGIFVPALKKGSSLDQKFIFGAFFIFWFPIAISGEWVLSPFSWLILGVTFNLLRFSAMDISRPKGIRTK